jgi:arylsulfatase A-like enzyme
MNVKVKLLCSIAFVLVALAACTRERAPRPNILLIVIDALRADRLGSYGNPDGLSPFIDSLAARGHVFHNAYAQSPWTKASIASLITSRYPSQHGVNSLSSVVADEETTLAEELKARGYASAGFSANILLYEAGGYAQGYDVYRALAPEQDAPRLFRPAPRADEIGRLALEWLDALPVAGRPPFFLHLHLMETHTPYKPHQAALRARFAGRDQPDLEAVNHYAVASQMAPIGDELLEDMIGIYEAEVMSVDDDLRSLFEQLDRRGVLDQTLVMITADHGEEFLDHGFMGHSKTLYNEVIRVPLIIALPGQRTRIDVHAPVSLVDLAPTLLDLQDEPVPSTFEGRSLRPLMRVGPWYAGGLGSLWPRGSRSGDRPAISELITDRKRDPSLMSLHSQAVATEKEKLIIRIDGTRKKFDLDSDPAEQQPALAARPTETPLEEALAAFNLRVAAGVSSRESRPLDAGTREQMRALGYFD